jgi:Zinc carboxypeptidase
MKLRRVTLPLTCIAVSVLALCAPVLPAQSLPNITTPKEALGFNLGDDYHMASYTQLEAYWTKLASESERMKLVDIGPTAEGRPQYMAIISSPENIKNLSHYEEISRRLALAKGLTDEQAHELAKEGKAIVWIDGGLHATETVGSQQIMELVYQMVSRTDPDTMRFLHDDILLAVQANPDGQEIVSNWYMREPDPTKRSLEGLPVLFDKYIGHDNNRDFYMSNMPETTNMNKVMFTEWYPQIVYNHHQPGPNQNGAVIFMPPFRDPFNYVFDPLIPLDVEEVGTAMHQGLVAADKPGSGMRTFTNYSTWWDGGLRTINYFHNAIGILTEIIGDPTPQHIPLVPDMQLPHGDLPFPIAPQEWHYRESIDYEIINNRSILDYASKNREDLLYQRYLMGKTEIEEGSEDSWTITPKRITALENAAVAEDPKLAVEAKRIGRDGGPLGLGGVDVPVGLYNTVLHAPAARDPRGYIITTDQPDFPTAVKFVNALLKAGVEVYKANAAFEVAGKQYPAGSYVVKTDQAFRPYVLDMFEPQDYPNDFKYPGGPPIPPYDLAGWTLAMQMGVKFDRELDGFTGPFQQVTNQQAPPPGIISGPENPAGYLISHRTNNSFIVVNRLLKAGCDVYWLKQPVSEQSEWGAGTIWVPASAAVRPILESSTKELGVGAQGIAAAPAGEAIKLKPVRIGLVDIYGGLMPSGWDRWLFEQYEFPYQLVYPQALDAGDLKSKFDVLVFTDGSFHAGGNEANPYTRNTPPANLPEQYRSWTGKITAEKTVPQLKEFLAAGGSIVTIGSGTGLAPLLGVPIRNYLAEPGKNGKEVPYPPEKIYIPGSLLRATVDNTDPVAYGMPPQVYMDFDKNPVFGLLPDAQLKHTRAVAWFSGDDPLASGWAWGQQYLNGGTAVVDSNVDGGKVLVMGPLVTFRGQPHDTFKMLFNGVYYGNGETITLK